MFTIICIITYGLLAVPIFQPAKPVYRLVDQADHDCLKVINDTLPRFAPDTISTHDVFGLTLSSDGQKAYFVKSYGGRDSLHIYQATRSVTGWRKPEKLPIGGNFKDIDPVVSPDGKRLIFNSTRPKPGRPASTDFDIWLVPLIQGRVGEPTHLGNLVNSDSADFYASMTRTGTLYFTSNRRGGQGQADIWRSIYKNGKYQMPENVGPVINTSEYESNPCIAPDETYLIYAGDTNLPGFGDGDLYVSFLKKGKWSKPQNLGPDINTADAEFAPTLSNGGKTLLFSRIKRGKPLIEDVYIMTDFDVLLNRLRPKARF